MARDGCQPPQGRHSHHHTGHADSDSSDEILIKGRSSRRARRDADKKVTRQLKSIEKARREGLRSRSSSSQEIHIHYIPVVTKSPTPPLADSCQSTPRSSTEAESISKSARLTVSDITNQLKDFTKSWLSRHSNESPQNSRPRSSKHEKRAKHGKKRVSTSKYLAPLAQRWVCYECGRVRSSIIEARHPLKEGHKMHPNWCGKCRVHGELHGRPLNFEGKRHYCWGCGILRSQTYNDNNPIRQLDMSQPNYCRPCRESSPTFSKHLREASEAGSVVSVHDKAFMRQMRDADLSAVEEESEDPATSARGKENQDPKPTKKQLKASKSFMLENFSCKINTFSDASSAERGVPISILKAQYLDAERARSASASNTSGASRGGCSGGPYQPPNVESEVSETSTSDVKARETMAPSGEDAHYETKSPLKPAREDVPSSPPTILAYNRQDSDDSYTKKKKKVHWLKQAIQPTTTNSDASDSAYCSNYPSDLTTASKRSRHVRRGPGEYSTGSPPVREGETIAGDMRHDVRKHNNSSVRRSESRGKGSDHESPTDGIFGQPIHSFDANMGLRKHDLSESGHSHSTPPTSSGAQIHGASESVKFAGGAGYEKPFSSESASPEIPNFSRPPQNLGKTRVNPDLSQRDLNQEKQRSKASHMPDPFYHSGYGARPGYMQEYSSYRSAAQMSTPTQRHDFSGFDAPGEEPAMYGDQYGRYGGPAQHSDWPRSAWPIFGESDTCTTDDSTCSPAPESSGADAFDFSGFGAASSEDPKSVGAEGETFVRKKKTTTATPKGQSWHLYDDGEAGAAKNQGCRWRRDGRTTIHHSGGEQMLNSGNTAQIMSIREMTSDEELSGSDDSDQASELSTVAGATLKSICAASSLQSGP
ncbi:unnamed protein product [Discula destructiva]